MALKVKMNTMDLDDLDTDIPLFATIEDEENDLQVDENTTMKIQIKVKEEQYMATVLLFLIILTNVYSLFQFHFLMHCVDWKVFEYHESL